MAENETDQTTGAAETPATDGNAAAATTEATDEAGKTSDDTKTE